MGLLGGLGRHLGADPGLALGRDLGLQGLDLGRRIGQRGQRLLDEDVVVPHQAAGFAAALTPVFHAGLDRTRGGLSRFEAGEKFLCELGCLVHFVFSFKVVWVSRNWVLSDLERPVSRPSGPRVY